MGVVRLVINLALMGAFFWFIHWLVYGVSLHFAAGLATGMYLMLLLVYWLWRVDPDAFKAR